MNIQTGNVGNLGDILKHAALVQIALTLRDFAVGTSCYVETHSFLLQAPVKDDVTWLTDVSRLSEAFAGYETYAEIERPLIRQKKYRCSAGLVLDLLRPTCSYLAEKDPVTMRTLETQVISQGFGDIVTLTDTAEKLPVVIDESAPSAFLMLVDPFNDPSEVWPTVKAVVEAVDHQELFGAILVFACNDNPIIWPSPSASFSGPVSYINSSPYQLALYATESFKTATLEASGRLGWTVNL